MMLSRLDFALVVLLHRIILSFGEATASSSFEKTTFVNGSVACVLDAPSIVIYLDDIAPFRDSCIPPGVLCAQQCLEDSSCSSYNYKRSPRHCELFLFEPYQCAVVQGCYHAQKDDVNSCRLKETATAVGDGLSNTTTGEYQGDSNISTADAAQPSSPILTRSSNGQTALSTRSYNGQTSLSTRSSNGQAALSTRSYNSQTSLSTRSSNGQAALSTRPSNGQSALSNTVSKPIQSSKAASFPAIPTTIKPTTRKVIDTTTTSKAAVVTTTTPKYQSPGSTFVPAPTIESGNPCDNILSDVYYLLQVNNGYGLDQPWSAFKYGFSDSKGGYWLGNENVYKLTNNGHRWNLCADASPVLLGGTYQVSYDTFIMDSEAAGYTYFVSGVRGAPSDVMAPGNRKYKFTTKDMNNQPGSCQNNAQKCSGGWWWGCSGDEKIVINGAGSCGFWFYANFLLPHINLRRTYIRISQF